MRVKVGVVLETMWGTPGNAPEWFRINPQNNSGKRLIKLIGHEDFWVTNVCKEQVGNANQHGVPDLNWLAKNLKRVQCDRLLVCGRIAQKSFDQLPSRLEYPILYLPHPAARNWSKERLEYWQKEIQNMVKYENL